MKLVLTVRLLLCLLGSFTAVGHLSLVLVHSSLDVHLSTGGILLERSTLVLVSVADLICMNVNMFMG